VISWSKVVQESSNRNYMYIAVFHVYMFKRNVIIQTYLLYEEKLFMISPRILSLNYREKAKFYCNSDTAPLWTLNNHKLPNDITLYQNNRILVINSIKSSHAGSFHCWGYNNATQKNSIDHAFLEIQGIQISISPMIIDVCSYYYYSLYCFHNIITLI